MKGILFGIICLPFMLHGQQNPRVQLGIYGGMGVAFAGENRRKGIAYELGQSTIIKKKGNARRRLEFYCSIPNTLIRVIQETATSECIRMVPLMH